jgi:integrase
VGAKRAASISGMMAVDSRCDLRMEERETGAEAVLWRHPEGSAGQAGQGASGSTARATGACERQSVERFLTCWLADTVRVQVRPKTHRSYAQLVATHVIPAIGKVDLCKLEPQHVQDLLASVLARGRSPRTAQYVRAVLRRALTQGVRWGIVPRNVAALVDPPRMVRREIQPFTVEEIPTLLAAFEKDPLGSLNLLALVHGLRQGEALGLEWRDVDLDGRTIRVRQALQTVDGKRQLVETKTRQSKRVVARVTMELYSHVAPALQREAADQMDLLLSSVKA